MSSMRVSTNQVEMGRWWQPPPPFQPCPVKRLAGLHCWALQRPKADPTTDPAAATALPLHTRRLETFKRCLSFPPLTEGMGWSPGSCELPLHTVYHDTLQTKGKKNISSRGRPPRNLYLGGWNVLYVLGHAEDGKPLPACPKSFKQHN